MVRPKPSAKRNHGGLGAGPQQNHSGYMELFFFQKKKQKAFVVFRRRYGWTQTFREAEPRGSGGWPPAKLLSLYCLLLFPEKEAKSICSASQKIWLDANLPRSGTTGVWGRARSYMVFFFQKKKDPKHVGSGLVNSGSDRAGYWIIEKKFRSSVYLRSERP
jgi:hypothetical protein